METRQGPMERRRLEVRHETLDEHWRYNCEDTVRTLECAEVERANLVSMNLVGPDSAQQAMFRPVLDAMIRGVRIDLEARRRMKGILANEIAARQAFYQRILGHPLNPASSKQMQALFYEDFRQRPVINRATGQPTLNDDALTVIGQREPLLRPLLKQIAEHRSLAVFLSTFINADLDSDDRMRCSYNICGTETFRLASSKNAFGSGMNMQNIPKGTKAKEADDLELPNIRTLFIPDDGYTFFDMDLDRADLQVVVWEAADADLKLALRLGLDMHLLNACAIFNIKGIPYEELTETHPNYQSHRARIGEASRQKAKTGVHAVDYGCKARTLAIHLGSTVHEADRFIRGWLEAHPGIAKWHKRVEAGLLSSRSVSNAYGYRRIYFDRIESVLPEALAWIPQSTVALTINQIWLNIHQAHPNIEVNLQVHDSLAGQYPTALDGRAALNNSAQVTIPYPDPLIIPVGIKTSTKSWGDCA